jgi:hypothetical protein
MLSVSENIGVLYAAICFFEILQILDQTLIWRGFQAVGISFNYLG